MTGDSSFSISPFTEACIEELTQLIHHTVRHSYTGVYPPRIVRFFIEYHASENILQDAAAGITIIGKSGKQIIATATLVGHYVIRVFVHPEYQHQGLGKKIAMAIEAEARKTGLEEFELDASLVSRRFWEKQDWIIKEHLTELIEGEPLEYFKMTKRLGKST